MRRAVLAALAIVFAQAGLAAGPPEAPIKESVEQLVKLFSDGLAVGYAKFRHVEFGKIFGSDQADAIAIFNIEGFHAGNEEHQYLAFFESVDQDRVGQRTSRPYRLIAVAHVGGRMWREFDWQKVKFGPSSVTLTGAKYGPKDAACCPSVPIQVTFGVKDGVISETK